MAYYNSNDHSYPQRSSKSSVYQTSPTTDFPFQEPVDMMRHLSNCSGDSGYGSAITQISEDDYFPPEKHSPAAMSHGAGSPTAVYGNVSFSNMQYPPYDYLETSAPFEQSNQSSNTLSRPTPSDLDWHEKSACYKFVVPKGQEPYFDLLGGYYATMDTPQKVYLEYPRTRGEKNSFPCQYPGCDYSAKPFKRPADLERHYRNVHASLEQKEKFYCDYAPCQRTRGPFTRKDHFRDHLRDYHKEDIGSPKGEKDFNRKGIEQKKWLKIQQAWLAERNIVANWWRCPKCLHRVSINNYRWECNTCNNTCDRERADRIDAVRAKTTATASESAAMEDIQYDSIVAPTTISSNPKYDCFTCKDKAYIWTENNGTGGDWTLCHICRPPIDQYSNFYDDEDYASSLRY